MNQEDDFSSLSVAIVGLGLMGGSLAMAIKGACRAVYGVDRDPAVVETALSQGIVEKASTQPGEILPLADLVILAVPVRGVLKFLQQMDQLHPGSAIVMDLGSTKTRIAAAMSALPDRFDPIGGHPMCGKETAGLGQADARLFRDAPFALARLEHTSERACRMALSLVHIVGARALWLDPQEHDTWTSVTSHLPYLVANALAASSPCQVAPLVGPGFRSTTRLAGSSLPMMIDIMVTNQENILNALDAFRQRIDRVEQSLVAQDWETLETLLVEGAARQRELIGGCR